MVESSRVTEGTAGVKSEEEVELGTQRLEYSRAFGHITSRLLDPSKHKIEISPRCSIRVRATYNDKKMHVMVAAVSKSSGERRAGSWIYGLELLA